MIVWHQGGDKQSPALCAMAPRCEREWLFPESPTNTKYPRFSISYLTLYLQDYHFTTTKELLLSGLFTVQNLLHFPFPAFIPPT